MPWLHYKLVCTFELGFCGVCSFSYPPTVQEQLHFVVMAIRELKLEHQIHELRRDKDGVLEDWEDREGGVLIDWSSQS
jgi:hypothetical protein